MVVVVAGGPQVLVVWLSRRWRRRRVRHAVDGRERQLPAGLVPVAVVTAGTATLRRRRTVVRRGRRRHSRHRRRVEPRRPRGVRRQDVAGVLCGWRRRGLLAVVACGGRRRRRAVGRGR
jgi:hypothetical protein